MTTNHAEAAAAIEGLLRPLQTALTVLTEGAAEQERAALNAEARLRDLTNEIRRAERERETLAKRLTDTRDELERTLGERKTRLEEEIAALVKQRDLARRDRNDETQQRTAEIQSHRERIADAKREADDALTAIAAGVEQAKRDADAECVAIAAVVASKRRELDGLQAQRADLVGALTRLAEATKG